MKHSTDIGHPLPKLSWVDRFFIGGLHHLERATISLLRPTGVLHRKHPTEYGELASYDWRSSDPAHAHLPPIALIHGYNAQAVHYLPLARLLLKQQATPSFSRAILLDLLGHGQSDPPTNPRDFARPMYESMRTVLNREFTEQNPGVLVGNSLGGWLTLRYAVDHPERLKALILISPAGAPLEPEVHSALRRTFLFDNLAQAARFFQNLHGLRRPIQSMLFAPGVRALFKRPWIHQLGNDMNVDYYMKPEEVRELRVPTQLIWGRRESILPRVMLDWLRQHLPSDRTEFHEPETFGHCPQFDHPNDLARMMTEFLRIRTRGC